MDNIEFSLSDDGHSLSVIDQNLAHVPVDLGERFGSTVTELALAYNDLKVVENLELFSQLKSLTLDNNQLISRQMFPELPSLETLSANTNNIDSIEAFMDCVSPKFPNLKHLSLLKNPCCPNYFVGKDSNAYQKYRYYVAARMPGLRYLDASPVTDKEREEGARMHQLVARPDPAQYQKKADDLPVDESQALPVEETSQASGKKTSYGVTRYVYVGRQSEGNRFIVDGQL